MSRPESSTTCPEYTPGCSTHCLEKALESNGGSLSTPDQPLASPEYTWGVQRHVLRMPGCPMTCPEKVRVSNGLPRARLSVQMRALRTSWRPTANSGVQRTKMRDWSEPPMVSPKGAWASNGETGVRLGVQRPALSALGRSTMT